MIDFRADWVVHLLLLMSSVAWDLSNLPREIITVETFKLNAWQPTWVRYISIRIAHLLDELGPCWIGGVTRRSCRPPAAPANGKR